MNTEPVLVTGSTGYVGGRLVPQLLEAGHRVRVIGRSLAKLEARPWSSNPNIEMAQADVLDYESLSKAVQGCPAVPIAPAKDIQYREKNNQNSMLQI